MALVLPVVLVLVFSMVAFTDSEFILFKNGFQNLLNDVACLDAWLDSVEYELREYLSEKYFNSFKGFLRAMETTIHVENKILVDKKKSLLLQ